MQNPKPDDNPWPKIALGVVALALVLTWAVMTLTGIAFTKALAIIVLVLFVAAVLLLLLGIA